MSLSCYALFMVWWHRAAGFFILIGVSASPLPGQAPQSTAPPPVQITARSMSELDDEQRLKVGDRIAYRVIEDQDPPKRLMVLDSGEVEVPYLGRREAVGKTCLEFAEFVKSDLEKELYKQATVLVTLDRHLGGTGGKVYVMGKVRSQGPVDLPPGEIFTVSKAILAVGGFTDFADDGKVRLIRRTGPDPDDVKEIIVDVRAVLERGQLEEDVELRPEDRIIVKGKLFNI